jgi:hypothetical protein
MTRCLLALLVFAAASHAQLKSRTDVPAIPPKPVHEGSLWIVPAGTKIPIQLRQPLSTKSAQIGDPVYAQTSFPITVDGKMVIPPGTWVQGTVDSVKRAGRIKGVAELRFHLTSLIYPTGYTLDIAAAVSRVPGDVASSMKEPGMIQHDSEKGKDLEKIGTASTQGAVIGSLAGVTAVQTPRGVGVGGLTGAAAGTFLAILTRGTDVTFDTGSSVEIGLNQAMALDGEKIGLGPQ